MKNITLIKMTKIGVALCAVTLGMLTSYSARAVDININLGANVFDAQDDYVYYPAYHMYYSKHHNRWAYQEGNRWVMAATPPNVSVDVLRASPSVPMDFHDSPANHHAEMVQKYPKDWHSAHDTKDVRKNDTRGNDDHHDDRAK
jgi:hypothetical protein